MFCRKKHPSQVARFDLPFAIVPSSPLSRVLTEARILHHLAAARKCELSQFSSFSCQPKVEAFPRSARCLRGWWSGPVTGSSADRRE